MNFYVFFPVVFAQNRLRTKTNKRKVPQTIFNTGCLDQKFSFSDFPVADYMYETLLV